MFKLRFFFNQQNLIQGNELLRFRQLDISQRQNKKDGDSRK